MDCDIPRTTNISTIVNHLRKQICLQQRRQRRRTASICPSLGPKNDPEDAPLLLLGSQIRITQDAPRTNVRSSSEAEKRGNHTPTNNSTYPTIPYHPVWYFCDDSFTASAEYGRFTSRRAFQKTRSYCSPLASDYWLPVFFRHTSEPLYNTNGR